MSLRLRVGPVACRLPKHSFSASCLWRSLVIQRTRGLAATKSRVNYFGVDPEQHGCSKSSHGKIQRSERPPVTPEERLDARHWKRRLADFVSFPFTHLIWSTVLRCSIAWHRPDLWDVHDFNKGVEVAVSVVFDLLASSNVDELHDRRLVDDFLFARLQHQLKYIGNERWSAPPELKSVSNLGLLWSKLLVDASIEDAREQSPPSPPMLRVTALLLCRELYHFETSDDDALPQLVWRLQRCTLERELKAEGSWTIVDLGPECWYWKR